MAAIEQDGGLDFDTIVRMTRAVGQTMDRLAEWEVATLAPMLDKSETGAPAAHRGAAPGGDDRDQLRGAADLRLAAAPRWRRSPGWRAWRTPEDEQVAQATVGFADLVSFSALTNGLDEDEIGDLVEVFEGRSHDVVARRGGRVVKTLGDSVLYMAATPAEGVDIAWDIVKMIGGDERLPDVRVGVVTGPVVLRMGDVYGPAVNLAARLVGVARRNRVITDLHTAELLPSGQVRDPGAAGPAGARVRRPRAGGRPAYARPLRRLVAAR